MENKEEVLRAIDIAIKGYQYSLNKEYFELYSARIHKGVCAYLIKNGVSRVIVAKINEIGREFLESNYKEFKKDYKKCFYRYNKTVPYWSSCIPCNSTDNETMQQSLELRLRILKSIQVELQLL